MKEAVFFAKFCKRLQGFFRDISAVPCPATSKAVGVFPFIGGLFGLT